MGYGHQRTAYPLRDLAQGEIIQANDYGGIPAKDRKIWETFRGFYEFISKFTGIPVFGPLFFSLFDQLQKIFSFYPKRKVKANFQTKQIFSLIKKGWGKDLISITDSKIPFVSTFFTPAFMAEFFNYSGEIFCIICDTDIARNWVPLDSAHSRIRYCAPTERVFERLKSYGVKKENIFFTGYPLPMENIGSEGEIAKEDLKRRLLNLDPAKRYFNHYEPLIKKYLGDLPGRPNRPLTIMFSVGGAGIQKDIGKKIIRNLQRQIRKNEIRVILSVGTKKQIRNFFVKFLKQLFGEPSSAELWPGVEIIYQNNIQNYFREFNQRLRETDILWTKPSELSFYSALGLPIIIAPPIGSQEESNKRWLLKSGFGISQENPEYCREWLFDWLKNGYLAEAAMQGFIEGERFGTAKIKNIIEQAR